MKSELKRPAVNPVLTICELHRQIYIGILNDESKEDLIELLEKAYAIAKKMDAKLRQYKFNYSDGWFEKNKAFGKKLSE